MNKKGYVIAVLVLCVTMVWGQTLKLKKRIDPCKVRIAKTMAKLGFKTGKMLKLRRGYSVEVVAFAKTTDAVKLLGHYKNFTTQAQMIPDCNEKMGVEPSPFKVAPKSNEKMGVGPSPFIVFSKKQFQANNYIIDMKKLPRGVRFK